MSRQVGRQFAPRVTRIAPGMTAGFVREALDRAIYGVGPLPPAAHAADKQLAEQHGDVDRAVHEVIENHVRYAGAQGFVTNLGGLLTAALTIPANITGLALIQCRMIAGIAHLRGYDLEDPRVRNAILVTILGEDAVNALVKRRRAPGAADGPGHRSPARPQPRRVISVEVATDLISRVAGKRLATTVGRQGPGGRRAGRRRRRRLRHLADRSLRRPRAVARAPPR